MRSAAPAPRSRPTAAVGSTAVRGAIAERRALERRFRRREAQSALAAALGAVATLSGTATGWLAATVLVALAFVLGRGARSAASDVARARDRLLVVLALADGAGVTPPEPPPEHDAPRA